jgi:seryl-tRNA synthetase
MLNIKRESDEYKNHIKTIIDNQDHTNGYDNEKLFEEIKIYKTNIEQKNNKIKNISQQLDESLLKIQNYENQLRNMSNK